MHRQEESVMQPEKIPSIETITQGSITELDISDQEFLEAPNLAGARPQTKVGHRTVAIIPNRVPDSDPESDFFTTFLYSLHKFIK